MGTPANNNYNNFRQAYKDHPISSYSSKSLEKVKVKCWQMESQEILAMGLRLSSSSDLTQKSKLSPMFHKVNMQVSAVSSVCIWMHSRSHSLSVGSGSERQNREYAASFLVLRHPSGCTKRASWSLTSFAIPNRWQWDFLTLQTIRF